MGFRCGRSTMECCFNLVNNILLNNNKRHSTLATFIYLTKAFNTANHSIILKKLNQLTISKNVILLLKSYLNQCSQRTILDGVLSSSSVIIDGELTIG